MRTIKLKKLVCDNFKCFKHKEVEFSDRSTVKGMNGIGKSSLYDAVLWLLFDKNAAGDSATNIRPHDKDGNDIHFVDISVAATFDVDGREITLKKVQKENYVKDRATKEQVFKGNENTFSVNDIPKKQAGYKQYIAENFCDEETFWLCSSSQAFFRLDTKKRRSKLLKLAGTITDEDVVDTNEEFSPLADMLMDGTVDELISRSKGTIKRLNDALKVLPARIDEQEKSKVDIDTAELEISRNALKEKIADIEAKETDLSKQYEEYQKASDGVLEIQFKINDLKRKANEDLVKDKGLLESYISKTAREIAALEGENKTDETYISASEHNCKTFEMQRQSCAERWQEAKKRKFDENSLVCAYCGQEYPEEKKEALRAEFESHKAKELSDLETEGNSLKESIETQAEEREKCKSRIDVRNKEIEVLNAKKADLEKQLSEIPSEMDISGDEEYRKLFGELAEKEAFLKKGNSAQETRKQFSDEKADLRSKLEETNAQITKAQRNVDIDERINELQQEQRDTAQKIADEERILDLLERFNRSKMNMLTESVNKHFQKVQWRLFTPLINGGYQDVCQATVGGTDYEKGLNHGERILSNLDIVNTFQKMNDIRLPLFSDDTESVDSWRLPEIETQTIFLRRTDDNELIVTNE